MKTRSWRQRSRQPKRERNNRSKAEFELGMRGAPVLRTSANSSARAPGSNVMTDEFRGYKGLQGRYHHHSVNHSAGQYVKWFIIHTNGLEGAWSHFKRQLIGVHHWISEAHIQRYLDEFTWRWNRRKMDDGPRVNALLDQVSGRLTYKELIA